MRVYACKMKWISNLESFGESDDFGKSTSKRKKTTDTDEQQAKVNEFFVSFPAWKPLGFEL